MTLRRPDAARGDRWLTPRVLLPAMGVLGLAVIVLGVLLAVAGGGSGTTQELVLETCRVGEDPDCQLRGPAHYHADFALYIDGEQVDFDDAAYVSEEGSFKSPIVHIHPERYTVVHVHLSGTRWTEFFESLGFELVDPTITGVTDEQTCLTLPDGEQLCTTAESGWRFFVNGVEVDGIALEEITDLQRVLMTYGSDEAEIQQQLASVTDEACISSLRCLDRVDPNEPPELCQGVGECTG